MRVAFLIPGLVLCAALACGSSPRADLVLRNGRVITMSPTTHAATAVAIRGDRIVYVGDENGVRRWISPGTRLIDVEGGTVTPGLVDAHGHMLNLGRLLQEPRLIGTRSIEEIVAIVREAQVQVPEGEWVHGRGWDQNDWETHGFPTWRDLEDTARNPVYLERIDGHALWVNRRALEEAHITRDTPDPPGGRIVRDSSGEPTGVFIDNAEELIERQVPDPSDETLDRRLAAAIEACNRAGLTGVHDAGTTRRVFESLRRLGERGKLTLNIYCMVDSDDRSFMHECLARGPWDEFDGRLVIRSLKLRADGALGSRGAALLAPYDDDPGNVGLNVQPPDSIVAWTRAAVAAGYQVGTHAIGDRGNRLTLDAYETVIHETGRQDLRLRVEHCQILDLSDLPRFALLGVIASMQPTHATSDMPWAEVRVGRERLRGSYAWRSLLESGAVLAFGSDFPVESENPLTGLYAAVTRQDANGNPPGGWWPDQRLTFDEALRGYTAGAAIAAFDEKNAGAIAEGMRADLTVFDRALDGENPRGMLEARARYTIVRGKVVGDYPGSY